MNHWVLQLEQHHKAVKSSRLSPSRLLCVSVVKGRGSGDTMSPHSLHRRTPNTATARPLCCVWSRKLTGLGNQTAGVFGVHMLAASHFEWNSDWATSCTKDQISHIGPLSKREKNHLKFKVRESRAASVSMKTFSHQNLCVNSCGPPSTTAGAALELSALKVLLFFTLMDFPAKLIAL